jgi:hypothetical protein
MKRDEASIATPCGADWRAMTPRGKARLCETCDKLVHDLSGRSEEEARALLGAPRTDGLCIRYLHDADGNIWFDSAGRDRLVPPQRLARGTAIAAAVALVAAPVLIEACGGANPYYDPSGSGSLQDNAGEAGAAGYGYFGNAGNAGDAGTDTGARSDAGHVADASDASDAPDAPDAADAPDLPDAPGD